MAQSSFNAHGGRMSVAVSPESYIYSHFRHVSGIPASDGQPGAPLTNLRVLDILIDRQQSRLREGQGSLLNFTA
jgi:hypothetical protein